jgi:thiamine kinase-like enzyme
VKVRDYLENQGVDERIILKWIFRKLFESVWTELIWLRIDTNGGLL